MFLLNKYNLRNEYLISQSDLLFYNIWILLNILLSNIEKYIVYKILKILFEIIEEEIFKRWWLIKKKIIDLIRPWRRFWVLFHAREIKKSSIKWTLIQSCESPKSALLNFFLIFI